MNQLCKNCIFFSPDEDGGDIGECRRHAPKPKSYAPDSDIVTLNAVWPDVCSSDWCGEWESGG